MSPRKILLLILVLTLIALFFILDFQNYFNLVYFQAERDSIIAWKETNFWTASVAYFLLYIVVAALSLPVAAILTIAGGAVFGLAWGLVLVSFASTIGATLAFLIARILLRDWVQDRFGHHLKRINEGMERDGVFYLFTLRMIPAFPFFLVNVLMALTPISTRAFYLVSQAGMLFGTFLYVNVGAELGMATALPDIFNIGVIRAVVVLAIFPWIAKGLVRVLHNRKVLAPWKAHKPSHFDTNLVVIGAGSAGLVSAYVAALARAKVTLVERNQRMGGDCLNTGCVPSKALLRSASSRHLIRRAAEFGIRDAHGETDFSAVMARISETIDRIAPHDSRERYTALGVDCLEGEARIMSPWCVRVGERLVNTRNIIIATGAGPAVPDIPGIGECVYLTSDTVWNLSTLPKTLLVVGGGPIGCELAQAFARLGSSVTLVQRGPRLLPKEDPEISDVIASSLGAEGVVVLTGHEVSAFGQGPDGGRAKARHDGGEREIPFTHVLIALGRKAHTDNLGLDDLGLALNPNGTVHVNEYLQTSFPNIFACGDVAGPYQFTHMASHQAWYAAVNSLGGGLKKFRVNYDVVPWATFTDPEVGRVGLNEQQARERNIDYEVTRYDLDDLDRAIIDGEARGFVKVLTKPGKDTILGATVVAAHGAELVNEFILAMNNGIGLKKIMASIHIYPTLSESGKYAAGAWRRSHAPEWVFPWLERFHRWRRGER